MPARCAAEHGAAGRAAGAGAGALGTHAARLRLGAPGPGFAVRAMERAALGGPAVPVAAVDGAHARGRGRGAVLRHSGWSDPDLYRGGRVLPAGRAVAAHRRGQPVSAPRPDQPDHVGIAATLFLSEEPMAPAGAGRAACTHRVVAAMPT